MSEPVSTVATYSLNPEATGLSASSPTTTNSSASSIHSTSSLTTRPTVGARKPSGTIIVPRDAKVELEMGDEVFDEEDARTMSPRRNSEDLEKMSQEARAELLQYVKLPFYLSISGSNNSDCLSCAFCEIAQLTDVVTGMRNCYMNLYCLSSIALKR